MFDGMFSFWYTLKQFDPEFVFFSTSLCNKKLEKNGTIILHYFCISLTASSS